MGAARAAEIYMPGQIFHFSAADIHRVAHTGERPAVTLHVYSPPLRRMGAYVIESGGALLRRPIPEGQELRPLAGPAPVSP